jgi:Planctomycete cytochrome C
VRWLLAFLPIAAFAWQSPSFSKEIVPIFAAACSGCHSAHAKMGSLELDTYEGVMQGGNHGTVVVPGNSGESRLYLMIAGKMSPAMPMDGKSLTAAQIELIRRWIDAGAKPSK